MDAAQRAVYVAALRREMEYRRAAGKSLVDVEAELARVTGPPAERASVATNTRAATARRRSA